MFLIQRKNRLQDKNYGLLSRENLFFNIQLRVNHESEIIKKPIISHRQKKKFSTQFNKSLRVLFVYYTQIIKSK